MNGIFASSCGSLVVHYNHARSHASLGPGIPDAPESLAYPSGHHIVAGHRVAAALANKLAHCNQEGFPINLQFPALYFARSIVNTLNSEELESRMSRSAPVADRP
jgi:hypothetical protein